MPNEYDGIPKAGSLKLKKTDSSIKKKKKKKEERKSEAPSNSQRNDEYDDVDAAIEAKIRERNPLRSKTKAELKTLQMQERMREKRVMDKASKTHKMRVEDFNKHLDNLTEHFDIPKVSWTK